MRTVALVKRILRQFANDKRTVAFTLIAPLVIFTLVYLINNEEVHYDYNIGIIHAPSEIETKIIANSEGETIEFFAVDKENDKETMDKKDLVLMIDADSELQHINLLLDGSNFTKSQKARYLVSKSIADVFEDHFSANFDKVIPSGIELPELEKPSIQYEYVYGYDDATFFDKFGYIIIGVLVFVFVYILGGINFLSERTSGTLEKMLTTPIKRYEIIAGYIISFAILASIQTLFISFYVIYILGVHVMGSVFSVVTINLITALVALSLGLLFSTIAKSEFQVIQFIPAIITPQIFLCGLFDLTGIWQSISRIIPLKYTVDALNKVMLKGYDVSRVQYEIIILTSFFIAFMVINIVLLKRQRAL